MSDKPRSPLTSAATAQKVAIASSIATLLMFGAFVYRGAPHPIAIESECPANVTAVTPVLAEEAPRPEVTTDDNGTQAADENEAKVRRAVTDFMKEAYPNAKVEGIFLLGFGRDANLYLAVADTVLPDGGKRRTIPSRVFQFVRRNGASYWRAEGIGRQAADALMARPDARPDRTVYCSD
jgi:hypothetical protein